MAVNINIPKPVIDYNDLDNKPTLVTAHSELTLDDGTNPHGTTASDVGLGNVDNTSDLNKPISTATQTALNGKQNVPIVVSSNITAENDHVYHVVANATFTDPTGVEGRGYVVIVRNGTATVGSTNYGLLGNVVYRLYHSGTWVSLEHRASSSYLQLFVPQTRTINGLNLTTNRTLTTANINDSTDRRYVTDAQLTVIGNTSGTNTGDQDLSGLVPTSRNLTINGVTQDLSADRTFTVGNKFAIIGNPAVITASGLTRFISPFIQTNANNENARSMVIPFDVTINKLYIGTGNNQPASGSSEFTLRKNGVDTAITITIPAGSASGVFSDTTNSVSFNAGDLISIQHINNASVNSAQINQISISE